MGHVFDSMFLVGRFKSSFLDSGWHVVRLSKKLVRVEIHVETMVIRVEHLCVMDEPYVDERFKYIGGAHDDVDLVASFLVCWWHYLLIDWRW